jgi:CRISPR-associated exonuclease Cas4
VDLTDELRGKAKGMVAEMREYSQRRYTPRVKASKSCKKCSLLEVCLPYALERRNVKEYIETSLREETEF